MSRLFNKLPKKLLDKLPNELWLMIDKYSVNHYLNTKLKQLQPILYSYKITDIDEDLPCKRYIYKNSLFEWKINEYISSYTTFEDYIEDYIEDGSFTFGVILFKRKVINKFDTT